MEVIDNPGLQPLALRKCKFTDVNAMEYWTCVAITTWRTLVEMIWTTA